MGREHPISLDLQSSSETRHVLLSTAYLPPIQWFVRLAASKTVWIDPWESYHKQTYRNRCVIDAPNGAVALTIPVAAVDNGSRLMKDMLVSEHNDWRNKHWHALQSSYYNTPFFEFYQDEFRPFYLPAGKEVEGVSEENGPCGDNHLMTYNLRLIEKCMELIGIDTEIRQTTAFLPPDDVNPATTDDLRFLISPKVPFEKDTRFIPQPYYQVFAQKTGFKPNLSIIDLIFNMGPESILILRKCAESLF